MRERATLAGGTLTVESAPGRGTALYVRLLVTPDGHANDRPPAEPPAEPPADPDVALDGGAP
jgi:hypothetical protein